MLLEYSVVYVPQSGAFVSPVDRPGGSVGNVHDGWVAASNFGAVTPSRVFLTQSPTIKSAYVVGTQDSTSRSTRERDCLTHLSIQHEAYSAEGRWGTKAKRQTPVLAILLCGPG